MAPGWVVGVHDHGFDDGPSFQPYLETTAIPVRRVWVGGFCTTQDEADAQAARFIASRSDDDFAELEREVRSLKWADDDVDSGGDDPPPSGA
jgi:hypothetical protein